MASYKKILKNTTSSPIFLEELGMEIPASTAEEILRADWILLAQEDTINELDPYLASGDIVVNDGYTDLNYVEGKKWLEPNLGGLSNRIAIFETTNLQNINVDVQTMSLREVLDYLKRFSDHHSGWRHIPAGNTVEIEDKKQMYVKDVFRLDGTLIIEGELIIE